MKKTIAFLCLLLISAGAAHAQKSEVTVTLNETFFEALLDSVYLNFDPPQFSLAAVESVSPGDQTIAGYSLFEGARITGPSAQEPPACSETIKVLREMNKVRTAVRFRDGKVYMPIAFSGEHALPIFGCAEFAGWAEANIDLQFDAENQRLLGRARVFNVNLNGTGGIGGSIIARLLQGTLDNKLNPITLMSLDKLNIGVVPIPNSGSIKMVATGARTEIQNGSLSIIVAYKFVKA